MSKIIEIPKITTTKEREEPKPVAWEVSSAYTYSEGVVIIYATSRGKAKSLALWEEPFVTDDSIYTDMRARRRPELDKYWKKGLTYLSWEDNLARLIMVKKLGFTCTDETQLLSSTECQYCKASLYCDTCKELFPGQYSTARDYWDHKKDKPKGW